MSQTPVAPTKPKAKAQPAPVTQPDDDSSKRVSPFVKIWLAFHIVAIVIWAMPDPRTDLKDGKERWALRTNNLPAFTQSLNDGIRVLNYTHGKTSFFKYYLLTSGFWQYWDMFAPNPADVDFFGDAQVVYQDGTTRTYNYPRMYKLGIFQKYGMERFRKYYERANDDSYQYVWPAFAQRVALLSTTDLHNLPVEVRLHRHLRQVMPPDKPQLTEYSDTEYYRYAVDEDKLMKDLRGGE